jgi:acetoin utilization protein AcuB
MTNLNEELSKVKIHQIMTKGVIAANPNNKFSQVFQFFCERNVNHMPVCEDGVVVGIISNKDMMRQLYKHVVMDKKTDLAALDEELKLADVMTKNPQTADVETSVFQIKEIFAKSPFNCLPITHEGKMVGIVSPKDIMQMRIIHIDGSDYGGY